MGKADKIDEISKDLRNLNKRITNPQDSFEAVSKEIRDIDHLKQVTKDLRRADTDLRDALDLLSEDVDNLPTRKDIEDVEQATKDRIIAQTHALHQRVKEMGNKMDKIDQRLEVTEDTMTKIFETMITQTENFYDLGRQILTGEENWTKTIEQTEEETVRSDVPEKRKPIEKPNGNNEVLHEVISSEEN